MRRLVIWFSAWAVSTGVMAADVPGSQDIPDVQRPIGAEIVRYGDGVQSAIRIPLDRVQRVNNRLEINRELDIEGHVMDVTYQLSSRQDYVNYIESLLATLEQRGAEVLWSCESRACGVSGNASRYRL